MRWSSRTGRKPSSSRTACGPRILTTARCGMRCSRPISTAMPWSRPPKLAGPMRHIFRTTENRRSTSAASRCSRMTGRRPSASSRPRWLRQTSRDGIAARPTASTRRSAGRRGGPRRRRASTACRAATRTSRTARRRSTATCCSICTIWKRTRTTCWRRRRNSARSSMMCSRFPTSAIRANPRGSSASAISRRISTCMSSLCSLRHSSMTMTAAASKSGAMRAVSRTR